ncbi:MAG TPA: STAS domain-containing protein [Gemmataceae bacterium]|jgi:anti-anti-sigma factor|nr:STAS domain-containing protein [Gemmataceae bacterium]
MALFIPAARNSSGPVTTLLGTGLPHRFVESNMDQGVLVMTIVPVQLLDDGLAAGFLEELVSAVAQTGAQMVVLDVRAVKSMCSAALGVLVTFRDLLCDRGGRLLLCGLSPAVAEVFHITELAGGSPSARTLFEMRPDVPTAVACLCGFEPHQ